MSQPQPNTPSHQSSKIQTQPTSRLFTPNSQNGSSSRAGHHNLFLQESQQRQAREIEAHELRLSLMHEESIARNKQEEKFTKARIDMMKEEGALRKEIVVREAADREKAAQESRDLKLFGMNL